MGCVAFSNEIATRVTVFRCECGSLVLVIGFVTVIIILLAAAIVSQTIKFSVV